ncbi:dTDP-4-dehydrorhamnose 3,5-epimerase [Proteiniphilum sp.]|uniref:dTDP-4-dehydrorhamnose 3,5-epimerase n=1 Tax=Proteiniphilum sp. TaxID=1926877 RepID=UPI002B2125C6|nr:dTDP-4-dehydrorhamnose 3,5-epimerase [Proteiniphilum sp.]MEA4916484.1 dTDP-4-dehydrorhamnose 3,5-epimerase [Proteiniphilum sp.]
MRIIGTEIEGVVIIEPKVFGDERGYFFESFSQKEFEEKVSKTVFVQDNESRSRYGVVRGLHFQKPPYEQAKLLRVVKGKVLDVVVDIRKNSSTYGRHISTELSENNKCQLFIPRGCAHGFVVLDEEAVFLYKCDNYYAPDYESGILWNDPQLGIDWILPEEDIILSEKDRQNPPFVQTNEFIKNREY